MTPRDVPGGRPEARHGSAPSGAPGTRPGPVLVLGGTAWLGRLVAEGLRDRGHPVTVLARGRSGPAPAGVEVVHADRDDPGALDGVADRAWTAVVDLTSTPSHARSAAAALAGRSAHVVVVSSVSVYADTSVVGADERAATVPATDDAGYAAAKVAVEDAWRSATPAVTVLRAGLLGGPGDESGRSGWWPWRLGRGGRLPVPDAPSPTQLLDVRDLADLVVRLVGRGASGARGAGGVLDVVGPVVPLADHLAVAREVAAAGRTPGARPAAVADEATAERREPGTGVGVGAELVPVASADLLAAGVQPWAGPCSLPLWVPGADHAGFASRSGAAARASGLVTRPLAETLTDVLAWELARGDQPRGAGLTDDEVLRALGD